MYLLTFGLRFRFWLAFSSASCDPPSVINSLIFIWQMRSSSLFHRELIHNQWNWAICHSPKSMIIDHDGIILFWVTVAELELQLLLPLRWCYMRSFWLSSKQIFLMMSRGFLCEKVEIFCWINFKAFASKQIRILFQIWISKKLPTVKAFVSKPVNKRNKAQSSETVQTSVALSKIVWKLPLC